MFSRKNVALITLLALLLIKFAMLPMLDWQSSVLVKMNNQVVSRDKLRSHISNLDIISSKEIELQKKVANLKEDVFFGNIDDFKISFQEQIISYLGEHNLQLELIEFVPDGSAPRPLQGVAESLVSLRFSGDVNDVAHFHVALDERIDVNVRAFNFTWTGNLTETSRVTGDLQLVAYHIGGD